ncbi:MAG: hypothetical protein ABIP03_11140 [Aquihabitans sp.]
MHGTPWMPDLTDSVFIEDDRESSIVTFDRDLTSLTQQPGFGSVRALPVGRFESHLGMDRETLAAVVKSTREVDAIPVVANVDFGHTDPLLTIPVGGHATVEAGSTEACLIFEAQPCVPAFGRRCTRPSSARRRSRPCAKIRRARSPT